MGGRTTSKFDLPAGTCDCPVPTEGVSRTYATCRFTPIVRTAGTLGVAAGTRASRDSGEIGWIIVDRDSLTRPNVPVGRNAAVMSSRRRVNGIGVQ